MHACVCVCVLYIYTTVTETLWKSHISEEDLLLTTHPQVGNCLMLPALLSASVTNVVWGKRVNGAPLSLHAGASAAQDIRLVQRPWESLREA